MLRCRPLLFVAFIAILISPAVMRAEDHSAKIDFNRDIRPILSKKCFACHGPDAESREGGLRLDLRESAIAEADSGERAIVPGEAVASKLLRRVTAEEEFELMPPAETGDRLTAEQVAKLRQWIEQGAPYARHWSFVKPQRPPLPEIDKPAWAKNEIDHFVYPRLKAAGLSPSPEADRYTLIRRLSFDLRGLPPTPAEVDTFLNDDSANAYEKLVDRFLADPAYGERWAQMWLDLARYADSKGYGSDPLREIWRYRDWVIDAYNNNMPYDQFTLEQIAGDLLPEATLQQKMATAFHRNTMTNTEGGTDDEEFRVAAVRDRVDTTMQVWMGLTMRCSTCHDHKYDPITQKEYYRFYAYFNQTADNDQPTESPTIPAPTPEMLATTKRLETEIAQTRRQLETPEVAAEQSAWETELKNAGTWFIVTPQKLESASDATFRRLSDGSILAAGETADSDTYTLHFATLLSVLQAIRLETIPDPSLPAAGSGRGAEGKFVLSGLQLTSEETPVPLSRASADFTAENFNVNAVLADKDKPAPGWSTDAKSNERHSAIFVLKESLSAEPNQPRQLKLTLQQQQPLGRFRVSITNDPALIERFELPADIRAIIDIPSTERNEEQSAKLSKYYRDHAPQLKPLREKIAQLEKQKPQIPTLPVMQELPADKRRTTHLMVKGNFLNLGEELTPALPAAFHPASTTADPSRVTVAKWLIDSENPLTARVAVNRYWAQLFGKGIVTTEEDFGSQGELPSHPQLLDWLATEYMRLGWDNKAILKTIVMSATYRKSSHVDERRLEIDPDNKLLSRGPRFRLKAEMVRDQALALSGLLSRKIGGPSVYPPQPPGLWRAAFNGRDRTWATSEGEDRYRRGLYTFWRRTIPYPSMATFDAPSREVCSIRRIRTNTPLQAFVTLNDPVYVEAAQALARRIYKEGGETTQSRAQFALKLCLIRPPSDAERLALTELYETELAHYQNHKTDAVALATDPLGPLPANLTPAEAAAWTVVANVLLNLDAVLSKN